MALTIKQERFVHEYIATGNACEAYRRSYDTKSRNQATIMTSANKLLKNPAISKKIEEIRSKARKRNEITVDDLVNELDEFRVIAKEDRNPAAGVSAVMSKGKLLGMVVDRKELTVHGMISSMTDDELMSFIDEVDVDDNDYKDVIDD